MRPSCRSLKRVRLCTQCSSAVVRKNGLADTMSRYLPRRIEEHPAITLRARTEIVALDGDRHLDRTRWLDSGTGVVETHASRHVFVKAPKVSANPAVIREWWAHLNRARASGGGQWGPG
jgi:hypothetical protein